MLNIPGGGRLDCVHEALTRAYAVPVRACGLGNFIADIGLLTAHRPGRLSSMRSASMWAGSERAEAMAGVQERERRGERGVEAPCGPG